MEQRIVQFKDICTDIFLSFSDDLKLKMCSQQFSFPDDITEEIRKWIEENITDVYYIEYGDVHNFVLFVKEEDAMAFKLRWL